MPYADATNILTRRELQAVLTDLRRKAPRSKNTRLNLVIFPLSACCGLRASEITQLQIPGTSFRLLGLNGTFSSSTGPVTFIAEMTGGGIGDANDFGLWTESTRGGPITPLMREGDQPIGAPPGVVWSNFTQFNIPSFGRTGGFALRLQLARPGVNTSNDSGAWAGTESRGLHMVAREGDQASGTEPGVL